jgi:hypothetical protein
MIGSILRRAFLRASATAGAFLLASQRIDLFRYALGEASRLRMDASVNLCDGWCSDGPWITPDGKKCSAGVLER